MKVGFNFPEKFEIFAQTRDGWSLVEPYLPQIKRAKLVIIMLGGNDVVARGNESDEEFRLSLSETVDFIDMIRKAH